MMNVHYEACTHLHRTVAAIKEAGMKAAVTLNPHTPISLVGRYLAGFGYGIAHVGKSGLWRAKVY